jgi:predicted kinase
MPELIVVAGANGSGKSSLTRLSASNLPVIDPDAIADRTAFILSICVWEIIRVYDLLWREGTF